jgi:hypothetical protein
MLMMWLQSTGKLQELTGVLKSLVGQTNKTGLELNKKSQIL